MPVKNVKRQTNGCFEGVITGLNDKEKKIISKSVGDKYITESTNKLILKPVNTNGNDFEVRTKDNDVVVSFTQNAPGNSSSYDLFTAILSTATNEDGEVYNIVARFTKDENWDAKLNLFANAGSSGASFDITIPPDAYGNIAMASDLEPLKTSIGNKQDTLESGTNIKTINGNSLLGAGDITVGERPFYELNLNSITDDATLTKEQGEAIYNNGNLLDIKINLNSTGTFYFINGKTKINFGGETFFYNPISLQLFDNMIEGLKFIKNGDTYTISFMIFSEPNTIRIGTNNEIELVNSLEKPFIKTINGQSLVQDGSTADIKLQTQQYRHTITIYEGSTTDGNNICFTAYTPSDTPINSIESFVANIYENKLENTDLNCFGVSGTASALTFYNKIHIGTNLATTTLQKVTGGSVALSTVYATYTITDEHGLLN